MTPPSRSMGGAVAASSFWEPVVVTTLRRYLRRGASSALLRRLAGSARDWRLLNERWSINAVAAKVREPSPLLRAELGDQVLKMNGAERRLAILQIADDYAEAGRLDFPSVGELSRLFGVGYAQIDGDLRALKKAGRIAPRAHYECLAP